MLCNNGDGLDGQEYQYEGPGDVGPVRGHVAHDAVPVHDQGRPGRRATLPDMTSVTTRILQGFHWPWSLVIHLATPQIAEKLRSLSLRIGKPVAPPKPPSDTLFLSDLNFSNGHNFKC